MLETRQGNLYSLHSKGFLCYFFPPVQQATCLIDLPKCLRGIYVIQFGQYLPPWLELVGKLSQFWLIFSSLKSLSSKQTLQKYSCWSSWKGKLVLFFDQPAPSLRKSVSISLSLSQFKTLCLRASVLQGENAKPRKTDEQHGCLQSSVRHQ